MIKIFEDWQGISKQECKEIFSKFPQNLKAKIIRKSGAKAQKMCIIEYFYLQKLLKRDNLQTLEFSEKGKPFIIGEKFFNISNSEDVFCIALSDTEVGVDLQKIFAYDERLARKICNQKEFEEIYASKDKALSLTKLWAQKESLIKCRGETIGQDLKTLLEDVREFEFCFDRYKDFIICECKKTL